MLPQQIEERRNADREADSALARLVWTALQQTELSGLSAMLECVARALKARACVLWEMAPGSDLKVDPPKGRLLILAQWLEDGLVHAFREAPLLGSATGEAVLSGQVVTVDDVASDRRVSQEARNLLASLGIREMCCTPLTFSDGAKGTLNLYRSNGPFQAEECKLAMQLTELIPPLYQAIRDKVAFQLVQVIREILEGDDEQMASTRHPLPDLKKMALPDQVLKKVCRSIAGAFHCVEASIFLRGVGTKRERFDLKATTWEAGIHRRYFRGSEAEGPTGWVLANAKPMIIPDLGKIDRDRAWLRRRYPGLVARPLGAAAPLREALKIEPAAPLPPLCFMAAPIESDGEVLGVVRCCSVDGGPHYFAERELILLCLVATQILQYWRRRVSRAGIVRENRAWRDLVERMGTLNAYVHQQLQQVAPDERSIFRQALELTQTAIPGAEIMDVRLLDPESQELFFVEPQGAAWEEGTPQEIQERKNKRFSINGTSAAAHVYRTRTVYEVRNVDEDPHYRETFPNAKGIIVAPISLATEFYGVIDIRRVGRARFPPHSKQIAELVGQQLGLYQFLARTINRVRGAEDSLRRTVTQQNQILQDLEHQLKSPVITAHARVDAALNQIGGVAGEASRRSLLAVRGLCAKATRVVGNMDLFTKLARGDVIQTERSRLMFDPLVRMLIEAASDHELLVDPSRTIRFDVERPGFEALWHTIVTIDSRLLEQAISNVLDNAAKYSFARAVVRIFGGFTGTGRFHISVINRGLRIHSDEIRQCGERGFRGEEARDTTGEGSGIGLWIVRNVMKAHDGELVIVPTTPDGFTEVKLVFPTEQA